MWNRLSLGGRYLIVLAAGLVVFLIFLFLLRFFIADDSTAPEAKPNQPEEPTPQEAFNQTHRLQSGETIGNVLLDQGIPGNQTQAVTVLLSRATDLRRVPIGTEIKTLTADTGLVHVQIRPPKSQFVYNVRRGIDDAGHMQFKAATDTLQADTTLVYAEGSIETTFWDAFMASGGNPQMAIKYIEIFQFVIYFSSETRIGDGYRLLVEEIRLEDEVIGYGHVPAAQYFQADGDTLTAVWRPDPESDYGGDYFDTDGVSFRRDLLRAPFPAARVTSTFGMRTHPITGNRRMHKGVDFGAPRGTPVVASGSGTITRLERNDPGYGNWVEITHGNSGYVTRYGHFTHHARGLRRGQWVKQGKVIGYVGATGMATGPHLHYEVRKDGRHMNPLRVKGKPVVKLTGGTLDEFVEGRYTTWRKRLENPFSMKDITLLGTVQGAHQASRLPRFMYDRVQRALLERDSLTAPEVRSSEEGSSVLP